MEISNVCTWTPPLVQAFSSSRLKGIDRTCTSGLLLRREPLSLMIFAGWLRNSFVALEVLQTFLVWRTKV
jgi:hypothetical protein